MRRLLASLRQFFSELRRRKVYRVAAGYLAASFVVVELADIAAGTFDLPGWFGPMVWVVVGLGFPIALVLAWALEVTPEGVRVDTAEETSTEDAEEKRPAGRSTVPSLWAGASILALMLLGAWWLFGGLGPAEQASDASAEIQDRSIAVLPFEVSGAGAEEWRDGMVTALSLNLDGAAGLRAIAGRTIFAAWEKKSGTEGGMGTEDALRVAQEVGARYALIGEAVQLGEDLRFAAEVYRTGSGKQLGQVEVEGPPGSITALTDELTRKVLGVLLDRSEEAIPSVDLASITTSSLEALKSFLEGERHFRAEEYEAALQDYRAATDQDSTFALAHARRGILSGWVGDVGGEDRAFRKAYELSGRLPLRERRLIWAQYARHVQHRSLTVADSLRQWTKIYPDDPQVWYWLGEVIFHGVVPGGWSEAEKALQEATRLDPGVAPYHYHLMDIAMSLHHDSALAARRIEAHPEGPVKKIYETFWDLNFGSPERRQRAWTRLDTLSLPNVQSPWWLHWPLLHPTDRALQAQVVRRVAERGALERAEANEELFENHLARGQIEAAITEFPDETQSACRWALSLSLGYPVPDSLLQTLEPPQVESPGCASIYLVETGRPGDVGPLLARLRDDMEQEGESERSIEAIMNALRGYRAWKTGDLKQAETLLSKGTPPGDHGALWRGDLYRELGQLQTAADWYLAAWTHPVAHERLGRLYEEMGKPEKAADAYERFIAAWNDADPELQDRVEATRVRVQSIRDTNTSE